ncbi:MAG: ADP-ribosylglycohydrolase family protein [Myxococcales bacterium]
MSSIRPDAGLLKKHPNAITLDQLQEKDRFLGALLGAAAGESLGAPHEGKPAGEVGPLREISAGGIWAAGEPTDDIELTLALLRSVVARRRFDQDDAARRYLEWFSRGPKDIGMLTRAALENLRAGDPPEQASALAWEDSGRRAAGNGSVMCCAPIGLLHVRRLEGLAEDAAGASRITHHDPRCVAGCIAVATAVALLVRGGREAEEAIPLAAEAAGTVSDEVRAAVERGASRRPADMAVDGEDRGFVLRTVEIAFGALATGAGFEEGLVAVISRGGDTDTNGAVAGALLGAKHGKGRIPERWLKPLKAAAELASLGDQLYRQL